MKTIHRDTVAAYIMSADGKILFGRKDPAKGGVYIDCWHIPGGGIDEGETPGRAIIREVKEETGINITDSSLLLVDDKGVGESVKKRPDQEDVLVKMTFVIFKVTLPQPASEVKLQPTDDLIDLQWFDADKLDSIKMTPPAYALFDRIGTAWLTKL